jgi:hypothetical protein
MACTREESRRLAAVEILTSERTYLRNLLIYVQKFVFPLAPKEIKLSMIQSNLVLRDDEYLAITETLASSANSRLFRSLSTESDHQSPHVPHSNTPPLVPRDGEVQPVKSSRLPRMSGERSLVETPGSAHSTPTKRWSGVMKYLGGATHDADGKGARDTGVAAATELSELEHGFIFGEVASLLPLHRMLLVRIHFIGHYNSITFLFYPLLQEEAEREIGGIRPSGPCFKANGLQEGQTWQDDTRTVGKLFTKLAHFFRMYSGLLNRYAAASALWETLLQTRPALMKFVEQAQQDPICDHQPLSSFMIMPVQRLPRYRLLIKELLQ